jgi:hypothetical protein
MIAVCLLTCDRVPYTRVTVESWARYNGSDDPRLLLLHGDDASVEPTNRDLANAYGFRTVVQHRVRQGNRATRVALMKYAAKRADWILILENDIESIRPFPWPLFEFVQANRDLSSLRLFGKFKDRDGCQPCLTTHKREGHAPVEWRPARHAPEPAQVGRIHWSAQPTVTRSRELVELHRKGVEPPGRTVRVKQNVMVHIGVERTPALESVAC